MPKNSSPSLSKDRETADERKPAVHRPKAVKEIDVNSLFEGSREVALIHRGDIYSLRITANDKLILTK